ncbi:MAG: hypothetical protein JW765_00930 [Deltaproteobacteria bacterium]|nr:hypothetical protein [Candidatus Zymogenaceae bacterium]
MKRNAFSRIVWGIILVLFAIAVPLVKAHASPDIASALFGDALLVIGCLSLALLGVLVAAAGHRYLKKIRRMTGLIRRMVGEHNHIITKDVAGAVGLHEVDVRERIDEMIKERTIPAGTRVTYTGGEKVVG